MPAIAKAQLDASNRVFIFHSNQRTSSPQSHPQPQLLSQPQPRAQPQQLATGRWLRPSSQ